MYSLKKQLIVYIALNSFVVFSTSSEIGIIVLYKEENGLTSLYGLPEVTHSHTVFFHALLQSYVLSLAYIIFIENELKMYNLIWT